MSIFPSVFLISTPIKIVSNDKIENLRTYLVNQDLTISEGMVRPPLRRYKLGDQDPVFWPADAL